LAPSLTDHPLAPLVTPARLRRIEEVLRARLASVTLVFEDLCDPHNVSAVLRTAEALGIQDVHLVERAQRVRPDENIALGAERWLSLHRHDRLAACLGSLQARGFSVWGADVAAGARPLEEISGEDPVALLFGSERVGLSKTARLHVDERFYVPMPGFTGSLNVSVAAAISLFQVAQRRRRVIGGIGDLEVGRRAELGERWLTRSVRRADRILSLLARREQGGEPER
jgi:tRNA (guanosine-2'-O-)-methyltransferase